MSGVRTIPCWLYDHDCGEWHGKGFGTSSENSHSRRSKERPTRSDPKACATTTSSIFPGQSFIPLTHQKPHRASNPIDVHSFVTFNQIHTTLCFALQTATCISTFHRGPCGFVYCLPACLPLLSEPPPSVLQRGPFNVLYGDLSGPTMEHAAATVCATFNTIVNACFRLLRVTILHALATTTFHYIFGQSSGIPTQSCTRDHFSLCDQHKFLTPMYIPKGTSMKLAQRWSTHALVKTQPHNPDAIWKSGIRRASSPL
jgi:hypothetical protein